MCNYVFKVLGSNNYQFRRKIPQDLIPHYGKKEIKKSLRTSDKRDAEALSRIEAIKLDVEWASLRKLLVGHHSKNDDVESEDLFRPVLNYEDYRLRGNAFSRQAVSQFKGPVAEGDVTEFAKRSLAGLRARRDFASKVGWYDNFLSGIQNELASREHLLANGQGSLEEYINEPLWKSEAIRLAYKALLEGNQSIAWTDTALESSRVPSTQTAITNANEVSLFSLVEKWAKERSPHQKTVNMTNRTVQRFRELVGPFAAHEIKRLQVVQFKDKLLEMGQSPENTNKQLVVMNTLLNFATDNAVIDNNPASGVTIRIVKKEKKRIAFDTPALHAIFSSPVFTEGERPKAGGGEAAFWLPLLALFTGARLEELGQLEPSDVMEEEYLDTAGNASVAWVLHIKNSESAGQSVKNLGSVRRVPLHEDLIQLGFLNYVRSAQEQRRRRIFEKLTPDIYGTETGNWSKWFGRYLRNVCKVANARMTFHSFRHGFKDYCRLAEIEIDVHDRLTGHVSGGVGSAYGSDHYPLRPLVNAMKKYRIPTLDFSTFKLPT